MGRPHQGRAHGAPQVRSKPSTTSSSSAPASPGCTWSTAREELGLDVVGIEAGTGPGGTWYWNRYPAHGATPRASTTATRSPRMLLKEWDWSSRYPEQPEILRYLEFVADRLDLRRSFAFDTRVESATWDERNDRWIVRDRHRRDHRRHATWSRPSAACRRPTSPTSPGGTTSQASGTTPAAGPRRASTSPGKRVAQIGTGSTGIQAAPVIAREAEQLYVFQRTPNYTVPGPRPTDGPGGVDRDQVGLRRGPPPHPGVVRRLPLHAASRSALEVTTRSATRIYEELWEEGGFKFLWGGFFDLMFNEAANETAAEFIRAKIRAIVQRPGGRGAPVPDRPPLRIEAPADRHRLLRDLQPRQRHPRRHLRAAAITRITPTGIETPDGPLRGRRHRLRHRVRRHDRPLLRMNITGRDGLTLAEKWADGPTDLPRPAGRRVPEPLHDHRSRQPIGADEHADVDRAARGVDRRLPRPPPQARPARRSSLAGGGGRPGWSTSLRSRASAVQPGQLVVPRRQHPRQEAGLHALRRRAGQLPGPLRRGRGQRLRGSSSPGEGTDGARRLRFGVGPGPSSDRGAVDDLDLGEAEQAPGAVLDADAGPLRAAERRCGGSAMCWFTQAVPHSSRSATSAARSGSATRPSPEGRSASRSRARPRRRRRGR